MLSPAAPPLPPSATTTRSSTEALGRAEAALGQGACGLSSPRSALVRSCNIARALTPRFAQQLTMAVVLVCACRSNAPAAWQRQPAARARRPRPLCRLCERPCSLLCRWTSSSSYFVRYRWTRAHGAQQRADCCAMSQPATCCGNVSISTSARSAWCARPCLLLSARALARAYGS